MGRGGGLYGGSCGREWDRCVEEGEEGRGGAFDESCLIYFTGNRRLYVDWGRGGAGRKRSTLCVTMDGGFGAGGRRNASLLKSFFFPLWRDLVAGGGGGYTGARTSRLLARFCCRFLFSAGRMKGE